MKPTVLEMLENGDSLYTILQLSEPEPIPISILNQIQELLQDSKTPIEYLRKLANFYPKDFIENTQIKFRMIVDRNVLECLETESIIELLADKTISKIVIDYFWLKYGNSRYLLPYLLQYAPRQNLNLSKTRIEGLEAKGVNFNQSSICDSDFRRSNLTGVNLKGVNFTRSNICDFDFRRSNLEHSNFSCSYLYCIDFSQVDFSHTDFSNMYCVGTHFIDANLSRGILDESYMKECDYSCADVTYCIGKEAKIEKSNFVNTNFSNSNFSGSKFNVCNLTNANFNSANLTKSNFTKSNFKNATFKGSDLTKAELKNIYLRYVDFCDAILVETCLKGSDLTKANLRGANLMYADLTDANLTRADLRGANLTGADFTRTKLKEIKIDSTTVLGGVTLRRLNKK